MECLNANKLYAHFLYNVTSKLIMDNSLVEKLHDLEYVPIDVFHFGFNKKQIKNQVEGFGLLTKKTDKNTS